MGETKSLAEALAAFQASLPPVVKDAVANAGTYSYKYAGLGAVSAIVLPALGKVGLSFACRPTVEDGHFVLAYRLMHSPSGESLDGLYPLPNGGKPQEVGSAITYARRYALCSVVGVAPDEDDDGAAAANTRVEARPQWDPNEQEALVDAWAAAISEATDAEELTTIGKTLQTLKRSRELSPPSYEKLAKAGAARKAELNGANA